METLTLTPSDDVVAAFLKKYQTSVQPGKSPYMTAFLKLDQATISVYSSGKVLLQGASIEDYARELGFQTQVGPGHMTAAGQDMPLIGSDEVGNGSYFGALTVTASFVQPEDHSWLKQLGVGDSKTLTDQKIRQLAPLLKERIVHQALVLNPAKYNQVIASGYNAVSVKVALHNQAIFLLLQKGVQAERIVIDAFTSSKNYHKYLAQESNHFSNPVDLEEKAEGKYLAVAVSSIIARDLFLENLEKLGREMGMTLPSGAGHKSDQVAAKILQKYGMDGLEHTAKLHFKNTEKAQKLARNS